MPVIFYNFKKIIQDIFDKKCATNGDKITPIDTMICVVSWVFDIYYPANQQVAISLAIDLIKNIISESKDLKELKSLSLKNEDMNDKHIVVLENKKILQSIILFLEDYSKCL